MPPRPSLPPQILEAMRAGWVILTSNQRAARTLRHDFDRYKLDRGIDIWEPPYVFAWDTWLSDCWYRLVVEGHQTRLLLESVQEHTLWRAVIAADPTTAASLRSLDSLADLAASAWQLAHAYPAHRRLATAADTADTRAFARWAAEFDRRCARANYLTEAQLPEVLLAALASGQFSYPPEILLVGFDSLTPAQSALLEALREAGTTLDEHHPHQPEPNRSLATAADPADELTLAAHWLRDHLTANPDHTVAVIVPDLESDRAEIDRTLRHILAPELEAIAAPSTTGPFEFSLGVPLARTPLVATALDLLRWTTAPLPLDRITALLLSPHFAPAPAEHLARAEFDGFVLRRQHLLQPELTLESLYVLASQPTSAPGLQFLLKHLQLLREFLPVPTTDRTHAEWAATMHDLLAAAGWATAAHDTSVEFQTRSKWDDALDELAILDFDGSRVSFATALAALERIATQTLFAPESRHAPIQILGPLEAAGSTFDALWFLRASDLTWPIASSSNPLLPWLLQRDLAMPGADPVRDAAHARRVTARLADSAPIAIFSYAQQTPDGHQRPSPALASLSLARADLVPAPPATLPIALEATIDDAHIPHPPDRVLPGGAAILAAQAACGFRAFAEQRLSSTALESPTLGLDPRERGTLVHKVLEHFWAQVQTQAALRQMPTPERDALLTTCIDRTLDRTAANAIQPWPRAYLATERQRLLNLLRPWLDFELTRAPFAVLAREKKLEDVQIGPLRLDIRVDRIDLTLTDGEPDGGEVILDYKTGPAKPSDWLTPRPDAPQLPLYAVVAEPTHLAGIAFAHIRAGDDLGLAGYESHPGVLTKSTRLKVPTLADQVDEWRTVLTTLAEDFHSGAAHVSPKRYPATCRYCAQRLLCRLDPAALQAAVLEDSDSDPESSEASDL